MRSRMVSTLVVYTPKNDRILELFWILISDHHISNIKEFMRNKRKVG